MMLRSNGAALSVGLSLLLSAGCASTSLTPGGDATSTEPVAVAAEEAALSIQTVTLPTDSPVVTVRLLFRAGSIADPEGKEGLAALTGLTIGNAGTAERSYAELSRALYPLASSISVQTDREVTMITSQTHRDNLAAWTDLLLEAVLRPGFEAEDLERNRQQLKSYLTNTLRAGNDEFLGLEALQQVVFADHPYGHAPQGTVQGLASITLEDVQAFYRRWFTRSHLILGVAGDYPEGYVAQLQERLAELPADGAEVGSLPAPPTVSGRHFTLIQKPAASVGIHLGYPLTLTWADEEYYPLMVANSYLGEHRTFHGVLMQELRGERGLNYGDYSYIEYYHRPPFTSSPTPNVPRRQQYFSIWVRPVVPDTAHFALRAALHYAGELIQNGMSQEEFELTREFLINYSKLWAQSQSRRLGFLMDSRYYGSEPYIGTIEQHLRGLTLEDVNRAIREHLQLEDYQAVLVAEEATALAESIRSDQPSPIEYESEASPEVLQADDRIEELPVEATAVRVVPVGELFEGAPSDG